jgi:hypothetical protein
VGERTFGKSLIQHLYPLPDGGALKLTVAEYLTPKQVGNHDALFLRILLSLYIFNKLGGGMWVILWVGGWGRWITRGGGVI